MENQHVSQDIFLQTGDLAQLCEPIPEGNFYFVQRTCENQTNSKLFGREKNIPIFVAMDVRLFFWIFHFPTGMPTSAVPSTRVPLRKKRRCRTFVMRTAAPKKWEMSLSR